MGYEAAMANDASLPAPAVERDIARKKRGNRSAKLKQCKLDARREQWLSRANKEGSKEFLASTSPAPLHRRAPEKIVTAHGDGIGACQEMSDHDLSPADSPTSDSTELSATSPMLVRQRCTSSDSSNWSSSRSVSDAEDKEVVADSHEDDDSEVLDDWEAVADALLVDTDVSNPVATSVTASCDREVTLQSIAESGVVGTEPDQVRGSTQAWHLDDKFRPSTLPSISKHASFPACKTAISSFPSSCPICCEDLDSTDSKFLPCPCRFMLCLFCHKRILEADGRCPGCRKPYDMSLSSSSMDTGGREAPPVPLFSRFYRSYSLGMRY